jgi:diaminohydroxyphosphoribosylaminopyrimidine deaminase / 5-amino-6-(5-phosphoribosylamino)uracil reductase
VSDAAWRLLLDASALAGELEQAGESRQLDDAIEWQPDRGWMSRLPPDDPRASIVDLYLPLCSATARHPITVGHLGQSLDGFIATPTGDSQFVTGEENILHLHRMRALSDAVVVGAGTVAADDPQLTTRLVDGPNALRVVFDPSRRLEPSYKIFTDGAAPTLYVCGQSHLRPGDSEMGQAAIIGFDDAASGQEVVEVMKILRAHGCSRVFVEGGGVTVSAFLEADLLDRLHVAVAPLLIGEGRPAIRLTPHANLRDCRRPDYRVFRMGGDVLFDCDLRQNVDASSAASASVARII